MISPETPPPSMPRNPNAPHLLFERAWIAYRRRVGDSTEVRHTPKYSPERSAVKGELIVLRDQLKTLAVFRVVWHKLYRVDEADWPEMCR